MSGFTIFFIAFFIWQAFKGYQAGFLFQLRWVLTVVLVITFMPILVPTLTHFFELLGFETSPWAHSTFFHFIVSFFSIYVVLKMSLQITKSWRIPVLSPLNRLFGAGMACVKASFLVYLVGALLPFFTPTWSEWLNQDQFYQVIVKLWQPLTVWLEQWLSQL